ncbi:MAG TPA: hypothetical protein VGM39_24600 [Kofleriaceae bacterium]
MSKLWIALGVLAVFSVGGCDRVFDVQGHPDGHPADAPISVARWANITAGLNNSCGIRLDRTLWCWGRNEHGQLGNGGLDGTGQREPVQVGEDVDWDSVSITSQTACAIKEDQSLWCWGDNDVGQVGNNTVAADPSMSVATPVRIDGTWKQVSSGENHTCAIQSDDTLWCWGGDDRGQLGVGTRDSHPAPTQLAGTWKSVSVGQAHTCAIAADDTLSCWGASDKGQLGIGSVSVDQLAPTPIAGETWKAVAAFGGSSCAITMEGRAFCWGLGDRGELGTQTTASSNTPAPVTTADHVDGWTSISGNADHACGMRGADELLCWGGNQRGQNANSDADMTLVPAKASGSWLSVSAGTLHTCAIDAEHRLWCAGNGAENALGTGDGDALEPRPVAATGLTQPSVGADFACARDASGLTCWGSNVGGALGIGRHDESFALQRPSDSIGMFPNYAAGDHVCGLDAVGKRYCWGANYAGQLGDGGVTYAYSPENADIAIWVTIASSRIHSCGIQNDASLWCWGRNMEGQIGTGTAGGSVMTPTKVPVLQWVAVATGLSFTCGLATDSNVYCWGYSFEGALGNTFAQSAQPTPMLIGSAPVAYSQVFAGGHHACAIDVGGLTRCWGANYAGQLGDGSTGARFSPQELSGQWLTLGLGDAYSCGIKTDKTLWCWGDNRRGQLGVGTTIGATTPQQVGSDADWDDVSAGFESTCAMKAGVLYCWGSEGGGAVGDGAAWSGAFREVMH